MGNFKIPLFQFVVNTDAQAILKADKVGVISDYAAGTNLVPGTATHLFRALNEQGWFKCTQLQLLQTAIRIRKQVWATAVKQISTLVASSLTATKGDVFRIVSDSFDLTPTVFQNIPTEKRYQISETIADGTPTAQVTTVTVSGTNGNIVLSLDGVDYAEAFATNIDTTIDNWDTTHTAAMTAKGITITNTATTLVFTATTAGEPFGVVTSSNSTGDMAGAVVATTPNISGGEQAIVRNMAEVINADTNAPVVATYSNVTLTLTAKNFGETFVLYHPTIVGVYATGTPAVNWTNDYENLKSVQWVTDLDFDRNAEYYPEKGTKYNSYYYEIKWEQDTGGHTVPGQVATEGKSVFMFYVKQGLAFDTAMDAMATDMNV